MSRITSSQMIELRNMVRNYIGSGMCALDLCHWIGIMGEIDSCSDERLIEIAYNLGLIR